MTRGYMQIEEGDWIEPPLRGFVHQCCGCALTHITDYRVVDGKVQFRVRIDNRKTAASRRKFKFKGGKDE